MNIRNDQQLAMVKALAGNNRLHWVTFENTANVGMSWYLTPHELGCSKQEVVSLHNREEWTKLKAIIKSTGASNQPLTNESQTMVPMTKIPAIAMHGVGTHKSYDI